MTIKTTIKNEASETGRFIEITVYSLLPSGVSRDDAKKHGVVGNIFEVNGRLATVATNFRLAPDQSMEVWVHDFQGYIVTEVS